MNVFGSIIIAPTIAQSADTKNAKVINGHVTNGFLHLITQKPNIPIKIAMAPPIKLARAMPAV